MPRPFIRFVLVLTLVAACGPKASQPPTSTGAPPAAESASQAEGLDRAAIEAKLDAYIAGFGKHWGDAWAFTGFVLVAHRGQAVYAKGFGAADRQSGAEIDADTTFRIGSVTKQFTATAILKLQEQGKLSVQDAIRKHLPDYPQVGDGITIHHLLTHTSGIPSYTADIEWMENNTARAQTPAQMVALSKDRPLEFEPGAKFRYSNSGYIVLGAIVEAASGQSYGDYLRDHVFEPAGIVRTTYGDGEGLPNRATGYTVENDVIGPAKKIHMSVPYAAGAIRSTANDLLTWDSAVESDAVLNDASRKQLYQPEKNNYAYGWHVAKFMKQPVISHGGGIFGFNTHYARLPEADIVVVAWTNNDNFNVGRLGQAAMAIALGKDIPPPEETKPIAIDPAIVPRVVGAYVLSPEGRKALEDRGLPEEIIETVELADVAERDGQLSFDAIGQPEVRMFASGPAEFFTKGVDSISYVFDLPEGNGKATALDGTQGPLTVRFVRDAKLAKKLRRRHKRKRKGSKKTR